MKKVVSILTRFATALGLLLIYLGFVVCCSAAHS